MQGNPFSTTPQRDRPFEVETTFLRLRYRVYCEEFKFLQSQEGQKPIEYDEYDEHSIHISVRAHGKSAAYTRIIPAGLLPLPIQKHFSVPPPQPKSCEISRFMISSEVRKNSKLRKLVYLTLMDQIIKAITQAQFKYCYAVTEAWLHRSLLKRGFHFQTLGEGKYHMGAITYPNLLTLDWKASLSSVLMLAYRQLYSIRIKKEKITATTLFPTTDSEIEILTH